jgi:hypothetical protein
MTERQLSKKFFIYKLLAGACPASLALQGGKLHNSHFRRACISDRVDLWQRLSPLQYYFNTFLIILTIFISGDQINFRRRRCA